MINKKTSYLIEKTVKIGGLCRSRTKIRAFKTSQAMFTFLNKQTNNDWAVSTKENLKSGTYAFAGGKWHNVKSLDISILAHI